MSKNDPLLHAISTNDISTLRNCLESQDRQLFSQVAREGTPEIAAYLLSRHQPISIEDSYHLFTSNLSLNPTQYLARVSAGHGNVSVFRYLLTQYPSLLSTKNNNNVRNVESILINAIDGGVQIWKIILEHDVRWKDHDFSGHRGCTLEQVVEYGSLDLLEMLLREGADTNRAGDSMLEVARMRGAGREMLELIKRYSE